MAIMPTTLRLLTAIMATKATTATLYPRMAIMPTTLRLLKVTNPTTAIRMYALVQADL
jgi:hypothetical protein